MARRLVALLVAFTALACGMGPASGDTGPATNVTRKVAAPALIVTPTPAPAGMSTTVRPLQRIGPVPAPPSGLAFAGPSDCDGNAAVASAAGGDAACHQLLLSGGVIATWAAYRDPSCTDPSYCLVAGFDLYDFRTKAKVASVDGSDRQAMVVPGGVLGQCFVLRALRSIHESADSRARCVTVVRTTRQISYGPTEIGNFEAMVHDNSDHSYCTRNSWSSTWAPEPWGFVVHTNKEVLDPTVVPVRPVLTIGYLSQLNSGSQPFPCAEGLLRVWRGYVNFSVPADVIHAATQATFAFTPVGQNVSSCFQYLWHANHWYYNQMQGYSPTIGINDGQMLDAVDPYGTLTISGNRASFDLSSDSAFLSSGAIGFALAVQGDGLDTSDIAHQTLHQGDYFRAAGAQACAVDNPHLEVVSVQTQSTAAPFLFQPDTTVKSEDAAPPVVSP